MLCALKGIKKHLRKKTRLMFLFGGDAIVLHKRITAAARRNIGGHYFARSMKGQTRSNYIHFEALPLLLLVVPPQRYSVFWEHDPKTNAQPRDHAWAFAKKSNAEDSHLCHHPVGGMPSAPPLQTCHCCTGATA